MEAVLLGSRSTADLVNHPSEASLAVGAQRLLDQSTEFTSLLESLSALDSPDAPGHRPLLGNLERLAALTAQLQRETARQAVDDSAGSTLPSSISDVEAAMSTAQLQELLQRELEGVEEAEVDFGDALASHEERVRSKIERQMESARTRDDLSTLGRAQGEIEVVSGLRSAALPRG